MPVETSLHLRRGGISSRSSMMMVMVIAPAQLPCCLLRDTDRFLEQISNFAGRQLPLRR